MDENQAEQSWNLSESAFKSLFYPLPAVFLDKAGSGMVRIDARTPPVVDAFTDPVFIKQSRLMNMTKVYAKSMRNSLTRLYTAITDDEREYNSLGARRMGILAHQLSCQGELVNSTNFAHLKHITFQSFEQVLILFGTVGNAAEYANGVHGGKPSTHPTLSTRVEHMVKEFGVQGLKNPRFQVLEPMKLHLMMAFEEDSEDVFVSLTAKAIVHLYRQLVHYRSTDPTILAEAPSVLPPDPHMCSYCGKEGQLHACAQCKTFLYCSPDCQTKHWKMDGPFRHRRECKLMADSSGLPPAIPVGRLVMIHGLKSAAGQRLNGKDAFVVTQPTDNGRLGVVLEDDVSEGDIERLKNGIVSWVPNELQKAIKIDNLELVWSQKKA